jgi:hypothetical protein
MVEGIGGTRILWTNVFDSGNHTSYGDALKELHCLECPQVLCARFHAFITVFQSPLFVNNVSKFWIKWQPIHLLLVLLLQYCYLPSSTWLLVFSVVGAIPGQATFNAQPVDFYCMSTRGSIDSQILRVQLLTIQQLDMTPSKTLGLNPRHNRCAIPCRITNRLRQLNNDSMHPGWTTMTEASHMSDQELIVRLQIGTTQDMVHIRSLQKESRSCVAMLSTVQSE